MSFVFVIGTTERACFGQLYNVHTGTPARPMHRSQQPIRIGYTELVLQLVLTIYRPSYTFLELIFPWVLLSQPILMNYLRSCFIDDKTWSYFSENQIIDTTALTAVLYAGDGSQDCAIMRDTPHEHNLAWSYVVCDSGRDFSEPDFGHKTRGTVTRDLTYCILSTLSYNKKRSPSKIFEK